MSEFVDGNKKIATFMGYTYYPFNMEGVKDPGWKTTIDTHQISKFNSLDNSLYGEPRKKYLCRHHTGLSFHSDWNQLMDVYIKITKLFNDPYHWVNNDEEIIIIFDIMYERLGDGDGKEKVWEYIVKFIDHYNLKENGSR